MALSDFKQEDVTTRLGVVRLWTTPRAPDSTRPMVFAIPGILSTMADIVALGESLGLLGDMCLMRLPSHRDAPLSSCALPDLAALVGELLETRFAGRPVVALGVSSGAVIALGVRAANLARIVAVEPPLATAGLWPVFGPLADYLRREQDPVAAAFILEAFGVSETGVVGRDHRAVLDGLAVPVDVVLGETALQPQRDLPRFPSLVDAPERRLLAGLPAVRLHIAPAAGHNALGQAPQAVKSVVFEACRRAAARWPVERLALDEPLLEAAPLTARRVLYSGDRSAVFAEAFQRINPKCEVLGAGEPPGNVGEAFDAVVLERAPTSVELARFARVLAPNGHLIARWAEDRAAVRQELAQQGLALREPVDEAGTGVLRAQKLPPGQAPRPALFLQTVAYSSLLMDIRTRLPTQGLRSDPELQVVYGGPPIELPSLPAEAAKVVVLQRPAELRAEAWRPFLADAIREGWVVVMEYDDYPPLVAEVMGRPSSEDDMLRFGFMHAVQTATPPLVDAIRPYNPETVHFPNAVFDILPYPTAPRRPRVFYGGVLRGAYAVEVAKSLAPALRRHPDVEFVVIGDRDVFAALPTTAKRYHEYMTFEAYLDLMSQCTISLSPIEALRWRDTKSDAKFLDAARAAVMTIASPTIYDRVIRHGENGFLAPAVDDWAPLLDQALSDEPLRERMARAAWTYVREDRMFAEQVAPRRDWYFDLWSRRGELNEALMRRVPGLREAVTG